MRTILKNSFLQFSMMISGIAFAQNGGSQADCEGLAGKPLFSLKAVAVNGSPVDRTNSINVMPGDQLDVEVFISCWGSELGDVQTFQASVPIAQAATSGMTGLILPVGWDAPIVRDFCPCENAQYPTCNPTYGCVGLNHNPELGAAIDVTRSDYLLAGLPQFHAVDVGSLFFRFGSTVDGEEAVVDVGQVAYAGTVHLVVSKNACGAFLFPIFENDPPNSNFQTFICDSQPLPAMECSYFPVLEPVVIEVCGSDGFFCNGLETCNAQVGCQIIPPPSCDDGVACTVDSCDEAVDGCAHALNHAACDDGDVCTRDECTPAGCVNIDDLCGDIPTASQWGLAVLALCLLIAAKVRFRPRMV